MAKSRRKIKSKSVRSDRARQAGLRDDAGPVPDLTVRIRTKGRYGAPRKWDYPRLVDYICERISNRYTVRETCRKIGISITVAWAILDRPEFKAQYARARKTQAHSFQEYAQQVADGKDPISKKRRRDAEKLKQRLLKQRNPSASSILHDTEKVIIQRNRLQMDAAKWLARVIDPANYAEKSQIDLGNASTPDGTPTTIAIQFVGPDGKAVAL